ncbi:MAG: type IV pilin N-terminal domain-containing protein [Methanomicrobiaceae archaeon]|nr:type IV pilin N-terminal domain-containing protein [Methanomicrobiaceae archaeon]
MMRNNEEAVSPVVGVMLMLVVTIIIAAVVSAFAGGVAGNQEKTPNAAIDVCIKYNQDTGMGDRATEIEFELLSGNPIPTKDLSIVTYYTNSSGHTYKNEQLASSDDVDLYGGTAYEGFGYNSRVPYLSNLAKGWGYQTQQHFGNYTWVPGDKMSTGGDPGTSQLLGMSDNWGYSLDSDFKEGSIVDIKLLHVPSGRYIYDEEVIVT